MGNLLWERIRKAIEFAFSKQLKETIGGMCLGFFVCSDWVLADAGAWISSHVGSLVIITKGVFCSSLSAVATNTVSYLYKKYILKIDQHDPTRQRQRRRKKAA